MHVKPRRCGERKSVRTVRVFEPATSRALPEGAEGQILSKPLPLAGTSLAPRLVGTHLPWAPSLPDAIIGGGLGAPTGGLSLPPLLFAGFDPDLMLHTARALARLAAVPHAAVKTDTESALQFMRGSSAEAAWPVRVIVSQQAVNPILIATGIDNASDQIASLLSRMVDPLNAGRYEEPAFAGYVNLTHCNWVFTSEIPRRVTPDLLPLLAVVEVRKPKVEEFDAYIDSIAGEELARRRFAPVPATDLFTAAERDAMHRMIRRSDAGLIIYWIGSLIHHRRSSLTPLPRV